MGYSADSLRCATQETDALGARALCVAAAPSEQRSGEGGVVPGGRGGLSGIAVDMHRIDRGKALRRASGEFAPMWRVHTIRTTLFCLHS